MGAFCVSTLVSAFSLRDISTWKSSNYENYAPEIIGSFCQRIISGWSVDAVMLVMIDKLASSICAFSTLSIDYEYNLIFIELVQTICVLLRSSDNSSELAWILFPGQ